MGDPGFLSFGHEVDILKAAEVFPNDVIMGNLEPALLMMSTPEAVYQAVKTVLEKGKQIKRGFVLAPGCDLPPMTAVENVQSITRAGPGPRLVLIGVLKSIESGPSGFDDRPEWRTDT